MPAVVAGAAHSSMPALTMDAFKGDFNVMTLIDKIAVPVLEQHAQPKVTGPARGVTPEVSLQLSMQATKQLSEQFDRSAPSKW